MVRMRPMIHEQVGSRDEPERRILVTGAAGFLGRAVLTALTPQYVIATSRDAAAVGASGARWFFGDLSERGVWERLPRDITDVVHLAARIPAPGVDDAEFGANEALAAHLLRQAAQWPLLRRVVVASTIAIYGPDVGPLDARTAVGPTSAYGRSKDAAERLLNRLEVPVAHLRFSSVYGPGQPTHSVLPLFVALARSGSTLQVLEDGRREQDFVFVSDAAKAVALALESPSQGAFLIGSGRSTSMRQLAETCLALAGPTGARLESIARPDAAPSVRLSIDRARAALGYSPAVDLTAGIRRCFEGA